MFSDYWERLHLSNKWFHRNYLFSSMPCLLASSFAQASAFTLPSVSAWQISPTSMAGMGKMSCWLKKICFEMYFSILPTPVLLMVQSKGDGLFYHITRLFLEPLCSVLRPVGRKRRSLGTEQQHPCSPERVFLGFAFPHSICRDALYPDMSF